jgi:hypothetical protein
MILLAVLASTPAMADGLFMGVDWGSTVPASLDPQPRAEDNDGIRAYKLVKPSVQAYAAPFGGRLANDGICDAEQPKTWDGPGGAAYKGSQATHYLYEPGRTDCFKTYYPGFTFFFGQPNMALAPPWTGMRPWDNRFLNWGG